MDVSSSKEVILKKIRKALSESTPIPFPQSDGTGSVYLPPQKDLAIQFAEEFTRLEGRFSFCIDAADLAVQLNALFTERKWTKIFCSEPECKQLVSSGSFENLYTASLVDCNASITSCASLVARTGSIVLSAAKANGRTASVYAPVHICLAFTNQLVYDIKDALLPIKEKFPGSLPSLISFATGPSRTADIEKTLVTGVHGPKEVYLFLLDQV